MKAGQDQKGDDFVPVETEVKISVDSFEDVRDNILKAGGSRISSVYETNAMYDTLSGDLRKEDIGLRLRCESDLHSNLRKDGPRGVTLTIKGPRASGNIKKRAEFELQMSDFENAGHMVESIGFSRRLAYEKKREIWALFGTKIFLDELPFGLYVEIEGENDDILMAAKRLGFKERDFIKKNYLELAAENKITGDIIF